MCKYYRGSKVFGGMYVLSHSDFIFWICSKSIILLSNERTTDLVGRRVKQCNEQVEEASFSSSNFEEGELQFYKANGVNN